MLCTFTKFVFLAAAVWPAVHSEGTVDGLTHCQNSLPVNSSKIQAVVELANQLSTLLSKALASEEQTTFLVSRGTENEHYQIEPVSGVWDLDLGRCNSSNVDFVFAASVFQSCLELEFQAVPLVSAVELWNGSRIGKYPGSVYVLSNRSDIQDFGDLQGQVVEGLGGRSVFGKLLQWHEMLRNGFNLHLSAKQVRYTSNATRVLEDLLLGEVDAAMLRADEWLKASSLAGAEAGRLKLLRPRCTAGFPLPHSTTLSAPAWTLSAMPHVPQSVRESVVDLLLGRGGGGGEAAPEVAGPGNNLTWGPAVSHAPVFRLMSEVGLIEGGVCRSADPGDILDSLTCPEGLVKLSREAMDEACREQAREDPRLECPPGIACLCQPCREVPASEIAITVLFRGEGGEEERATACRKLEVCASVPWGSPLRLRVADNWFALRSSLRLPRIANLSYSWWDWDAEDQVVRESSAEPSADGAVEFEIPQPSVGTHILEVKARREGEAALAQVRESPILLQVIPSPCKAKAMIRDSSGNCVCPPGLTDDGKGGCKAVASGGPQTLAIVLGTCLSSAFVLAVVFLAYFWHSIFRGGWRIAREDLEIDEGEVAFKSCLGETVVGRYHGAVVAVKQIQDDLSGGDAAFHELTDLGRLSRAQETLAKLEEAAGPSGDSWEGKPRARLAGPLLGSFRKSKVLPLMRASQSEEGPIPEKPPRRKSSLASLLPSSMHLLRHKPWLRRGAVIARTKMLMDMRHPNIISLLGAVVDTKGPCLLVMEYMSHGSLRDILQNGSFALDAEAVVNIARDVAGGLLYLHSSKPPVLHNGLKSGNILIDSSFRAKLSLLGFFSYGDDKHDQAVSGLWTAPELLHKEAPTPASDVYALGMVLFELFTRNIPFDGLTDRNFLRKVADSKTDPFRPQLPHDLPSCVAKTIADCWAVSPRDRPTTAEVCRRIDEWDRSEISAFLSGREHGAMALLGKARKSLDARKSDHDLLFKVFPEHVAKALIDGKKVEPEHHESVTIFFSDIVGFTNISMQLEPVDVMDMLDRLYLRFDRLAEEYDVFKVETIGDAYMAVANLAKKQPDHAARVARFGIEAIRAANSVPVKTSRPELGNVNIRVGFHTGPVVASVVGNLNPRYCLFGDTVNTASRMESNSQANQAHCSEASARLLRKVPGFSLTSRGVIPIKGKGNMATYWVSLSEDGTMARPSLDPMPPSSQ